MDILQTTETIRTKIADQRDTQKMVVIALAAFFAVTIFAASLLAFYWDGGSYIISTNDGKTHTAGDSHGGSHDGGKTSHGEDKKAGEGHH